MINQTLDKLNGMKLRAMEQEYQRQRTVRKYSSFL
jgi:hypothetical protein